ncbi:MAG: GntR family transcriptional regulator [Verrucomicrobia bacterium]|nr:GntR family transcriptional regulator [Verrucomicrobiota bacterium]
MKRLLTFAEQLARLFAEQIQGGDLSNPLPGRRAWAAQLGVGRNTLDAAIRILTRKGLLRTHPRHGTLISHGSRSGNRKSRLQAVRFIFNDRDFERSSYQVDWLFPLLARFHERGFRCTFEQASIGRIRAICSRGGNPSELNLLYACSVGQLRRFQNSNAHTLVIGDIERGIRLPSVNVDLAGAIRHACHDLLRRGFKTLKILINAYSKGIPFEHRNAFSEACDRWSVQPIAHELVQIPMQTPEMIAACRRLARGLHDRTGILVLFPLSAGAIMTTLLQSGISIPSQAEMILLMSRKDSARLDPVPAHYPFPTKRFLTELTVVVTRFFETGKLSPDYHRYVPLERAHD